MEGRHTPREERPRNISQTRSVFDPELSRQAAIESLKKLDPRTLVRNPVMFVVEVGTAIVGFLTVYYLFADPSLAGYNAAIFFWLLATVLFANFAEGLAEARGRAQADSLRKTRADTPARKIVNGREEKVSSTDLAKGDRFVVEAGEIIPADGEIIEGIASVDESAITGESAPVIREAGGDRSAVTGGTRVLSDRIVVEVTSDPGESFLDHMISLVEGASRQKTPNEIALTILLAALTAIFLIVTVTLLPFSIYTGEPVDTATLIALLVCLIPTTIGALLSAIGIAGMDRAVRANILAKSGRAVEVAGDVDTLLLDKTGTVTIGNRKATAFVPLDGVPEEELRCAAYLSSLSDQTPEGRSIVELAEEQGIEHENPEGAEFVPFSAQTRMSGVDLPDGTEIRKGAVDAVKKWAGKGSGVPEDLQRVADGISEKGGTPLAVGADHRILGVIRLEDIIKPGMRERFDRLRTAGIRTVMITGDNPKTASYIANEAGVDDFIAEATPEDKLKFVRKEQQDGHLIAMSGDGTNDAPALAQADVGLAMNSGTQAAKEAGNMVDLDSDPTKLIEVVEIGKQLLITRGALTTFSVANDVAKFFAIIPAIFVVPYPELAALNIMGLATPQSAILSAVIFNAIIIPLLIPLALRGVRYRPVSASSLLRRNLLIYGVGGVIAPFIGIKLIDLVLVVLGLS
ncbi:MAG: potassium-transporting ATPase subunit KdpB [Rubrobacter sp.]|nr:potassium-transporting ATPase subunit KdpB [Rubrobacter sp.]